MSVIPLIRTFQPGCGLKLVIIVRLHFEVDGVLYHDSPSPGVASIQSLLYPAASSKDPKQSVV